MKRRDLMLRQHMAHGRQTIYIISAHSSLPVMLGNRVFLLIAWTNFDTRMGKYSYAPKSGMKLRILFETSTAAPLSLEMDRQIQPTLYNGCDYLSKLGLNHFGKRCPGYVGIAYVRLADTVCNSCNIGFISTPLRFQCEANQWAVVALNFLFYK